MRLPDCGETRGEPKPHPLQPRHQLRKALERGEQQAQATSESVLQEPDQPEPHQLHRGGKQASQPWTERVEIYRDLSHLLFMKARERWSSRTLHPTRLITRYQTRLIIDLNHKFNYIVSITQILTSCQNSQFSLLLPEKHLNYRTQLLHSHLREQGSESSTHLKVHYNDLLPLVASLQWRSPPADATHKKWEGTKMRKGLYF